MEIQRVNRKTYIGTGEGKRVPASSSRITKKKEVKK